MRAWAFHYWNLLRSSLWFVPSLMALAAVLLSFLTIALDVRFDHATVKAWRVFYGGGGGGAESILSTIAGSMITVTGVVFSITVVTLSLASGQFGPRLLRNFMRDRGNQFVLGTFIGTFLYCLLGLRAVTPTGGPGDVPRITVTLAVVLAVASLAVLIYFIHHTATAIQADTVIANVTRDLQAALEEMYPEDIGEAPDAASDGPETEVPEDFEAKAVPVRAPTTGYLQAVDDDDLLDVAKRHDLILRVRTRPGKFVIAGTVVADAWPRDRVDATVTGALAAALIIGNRRTEEQDVEFAIDQLVEIAVRALSPGINDPFTAIACVNGLAGALCHVGGKRFPSRYRMDADGRLRVITHTSTFSGIMDDAFNQIRQYGAESVAVTARLLEVMDAIARCTAPVEDRHAVVREHAERVMHAARHAEHAPPDLQDVEKRYARVIEALADPPRRVGVN